MRWVCLLCLTACGLEEPPRVQRVDDRLTSYIDDFKKDCAKYRSDCEEALSNIQSFAVYKSFPVSQELSEDTIGICQITGFKNYIMVKETALEMFHQQIRALMYHEIAHCAYELKHVAESEKLMSAYLPGYAALIYNWDRLVEEMFKQVEERHGN